MPRLSVEVQEPRIAFLLGDEWKTVPDPPTPPSTQALSEAWQTLTKQYSGAKTSIATAMSDMDTVRVLVQCKPTDVVAEHIMTPSALEAVPAASRPLVLLSHMLGAVAGAKANPQAESATCISPDGNGTVSNHRAGD